MGDTLGYAPCLEGDGVPRHQGEDGVPPIQKRRRCDTCIQDRTPHPPNRDRTGWGTPPWDRLWLDRLWCGQYASCGFPQEDVLVLFLQKAEKLTACSTKKSAHGFPAFQGLHDHSLDLQLCAAPMEFNSTRQTLEQLGNHEPAAL